MKTLTVAALLWAVVALTAAAADDLSAVTEEPETLETPTPETNLTLPEEEEHQIVERSASCPGGWRMICGRCFRYVPQRRNWIRAHGICQSMGGSLASVRNAQEYREIRRLIKQVTHRNPVTWIGGYDGGQGIRWRWIDHTPFRFSYWCRKCQRTYWKRQHCLIMNYGGNKCWSYRRCKRYLPSVCVKKPHVRPHFVKIILDKIHHVFRFFG